MNDWRNVKRDGMPPCDDETVFVGINTAGFACCFNETTRDGVCSMRGPELSTVQMSGLEWWRVLDRPGHGAATFGDALLRLLVDDGLCSEAAALTLRKRAHGVPVDGWSSDRPTADGRWLWREGGEEHREVELVLCGGGAEVDEGDEEPEGTPQFYWMRTPTDQRNMPGLWKRADGVSVPDGQTKEQA